MSSTKTLLKFEKLLKEFNGIDRDLASLHKPGGLDNDVEHSYRVAMLCWMLIDEYRLKLDANKVIRYALIHDLPEAYAGDISMHASPELLKNKKANETKAAKKLTKDFPRQKSMWKDLHEYEKKKDAESRFVYVVEKLEAFLVATMSDEDKWIKRGVTQESIRRLQGKIQNIDTVAQMFNNDLMDYLKKNKKKFWGK
mgnify:CR=1 FL=1